MIEYFLKFNLYIFIIACFAMVIIEDKFALSFRLKMWLKPKKRSLCYKLLSCYPCFSFWLTLILTFNFFVSLAVYLFILIYTSNERKN